MYNKEKDVNITVIGGGKMGLPLATVFSMHGAKVTVVDKDQGKVDSIMNGICPFNEPGVPEMLKECHDQGRISATTCLKDGVAAADVVVVIVPVMLTDDKHADTTAIDEVTEQLTESVKSGTLISYETTLPVGYTRNLSTRYQEAGWVVGDNLHISFSPERVKSMKVLDHLMKNPKVVGGYSDVCAQMAEEFYSTYLKAPVINVKTLEAAEFVKLSGMIYRDVNIALANELETYARNLGLDFAAIRAASNTDGEAAILTPGIGVGGHCTPVYPWFVIQDDRFASEKSLTLLSRQINDHRPVECLDLLGDVCRKRVCIVGLAFRPGVKETAYSPTFALYEELKRRDAEVTVYDPLYTNDEVHGYGMTPGTPDECQIVVIQCVHNMNTFRAFIRKNEFEVILDGRGALASSNIETCHSIEII